MLVKWNSIILNCYCSLPLTTQLHLKLNDSYTFINFSSWFLGVHLVFIWVTPTPRHKSSYSYCQINKSFFSRKYWVQRMPQSFYLNQEILTDLRFDYCTKKKFFRRIFVHFIQSIGILSSEFSGIFNYKNTIELQLQND